MKVKVKMRGIFLFFGGVAIIKDKRRGIYLATPLNFNTLPLNFRKRFSLCVCVLCCRLSLFIVHSNTEREQQHMQEWKVYAFTSLVQLCCCFDATFTRKKTRNLSLFSLGERNSSSSERKVAHPQSLNICIGQVLLYLSSVHKKQSIL